MGEYRHQTEPKAICRGRRRGPTTTCLLCGATFPYVFDRITLTVCATCRETETPEMVAWAEAQAKR